MSLLKKTLIGLIVAVPLLFVGAMPADAARRGGYYHGHRGHHQSYYRPYYDRGHPHHGYDYRYHQPHYYRYYGGYYGAPRYHPYHYGPHGSVHVGPFGIHW